LRRRWALRAKPRYPLVRCGPAARAVRVRGAGSANGFAAKPAPLASLPLASNFKIQTQREGQKQDTSLISISCLLQLQRMTMENALSITQEMPDRLEIRTRRRHSHACRGARAHSLQRRQNLPFWGNMLLPIGHTRIRRRPPTCIVCLASGSSC
jgi:hypothetical protein